MFVFKKIKNIQLLDECSVEHLCRPLMIYQNKRTSLQKKRQNSDKCDLDINNLAS